MQGDLFSTGALAFSNGPELPLQREQLISWQQRLNDQGCCGGASDHGVKTVQFLSGWSLWG